MLLIIIIDLFVSGWLVFSAATRGFERTLPLATFLLILFPVESQITIPGLFDLTTQRVIVLTLLGLYIAIGQTDQQEPRRHLPLVILLALQLIWLFIATANSVVFTISLKTVLSQVLDFFVIFYIFAKSIRTIEMVHKILYGFVAAMIFLSFFGVIETYSGWSLLSLFPEVGHRFSADTLGGMEGSGRVQTTFSHAILFGGALAMAIPAALYLSSIATSLRSKCLLWAGILLMFLCIYKTSSRGPWLALILSLALLAILGGRQIRKYLIIIALLVATVLIARPGVWMSLSNMYAATRDPDSPEGESYQWRYALYDLAFKELGSSPGRTLWGFGPESFYYLGLRTDFLIDGELRNVKVESCDSSVAAIMMETGYVGLFLTGLLLLTPAFLVTQCCVKRGKSERILPLILLCNMCAYYFLMTNVAIYGWGQQSYLLWIILAMAAIYPGLPQTQTSTSSQAAVALNESHKAIPIRAWNPDRATLPMK